MAKINDVNSFKEFERIPDPELINDDDLLLIETEDGELKSVKYKDLGNGISKDGIIGDTGPQGPKGEPGVDIVPEDEEPDEEAVIWIHEGIHPEEDLANNIQSYLSELFMCGNEEPKHNPDVTEKTMLYFQIDDDLPESNIRFIKVPNDESDMQKQIDVLSEKVNKLPEIFVQSEGYDVDIDGNPDPAPSYIFPELTITSDTSHAELGSTISPIININYEQNDAGAFKLYRVYINNKLMKVSYDLPPESFTLENMLIKNDLVIRVEIEYQEGKVKYEGLGPYAHVLAGYVSSEVRIVAGLAYWCFTDILGAPPTSEYIRNKLCKGVNLKKNDTLLVKSNNNTNAVIFAYPKNLGECEEINYVDFDVYNKDAFEFIELNISLSKTNSIPYCVYYYIAPIVIGPATFILTV